MSFNLKILRIQKKIPLWKLAQLLSLHESYLSRVENERIVAPDKLLEKIRLCLENCYESEGKERCLTLSDRGETINE